MAFAAGYEELGPFEGVPERFRGDAVVAAQLSASSATMQALRAACEADDPVEVCRAVTPAAAAVSRGGISTLHTMSRERGLALMNFGFWALFASLPVLALSVFAAISLASGHAVSVWAVVANIPFSLVLGVVLWPSYGRPGYRSLRDIWTKGYVGDHLPENVGVLAGKCWLPGERALYIGHPVRGPMTIPYHEIGLVSVVPDNDGLHSVEIRDRSCFPLATIVPSGDGSRYVAEALAQTIRLKTMASLVV